MSGINQNGYAESKRLLLGIGDIYLDDVYVGALKGSVVFKHKREYAYQRAGNNVADQKGEVTGEEATIEAEVCDLKLSQLRRAFGVVEAVDASTAKVIRKREIVVASLTGVALGETHVASSVKVSSLDRKTSYVSGTDYKISSGNFERLTAPGALVSGSSYIVEYDFSDSGSSSLTVGGETKAPPTFRLDYVVVDDSGKRWQLAFFKAMAITDFEINFNDRESGDFTVFNVQFKALVDITKPEGKNLFEFTQEDATA